MKVESFTLSQMVDRIVVRRFSRLMKQSSSDPTNCYMLRSSYL